MVSCDCWGPLLNARRAVRRGLSGKQIHLSLVANPSHLEAVNTVVLGKVRAKQWYMDDREHSKVMPILLHGDGAFSGQVRSLPLGDATAIFFSSPAFTMLLSTVLLKDHCGLFRIFIGRFSIHQCCGDPNPFASHFWEAYPDPTIGWSSSMVFLCFVEVLF